MKKFLFLALAAVGLLATASTADAGFLRGRLVNRPHLLSGHSGGCSGGAYR